MRNHKEVINWIQIFPSIEYSLSGNEDERGRIIKRVTWKWVKRLVFRSTSRFSLNRLTIARGNKNQVNRRRSMKEKKMKVRVWIGSLINDHKNAHTHSQWKGFYLTLSLFFSGHSGTTERKWEGFRNRHGQRKKRQREMIVMETSCVGVCPLRENQVLSPAALDILSILLHT